LMIARALLAEPRVLLLDEPTRALDPVSARALRQFLRRELVDRQGCTIVLATHSAEEAFDFCDQVTVLHQGSLLATGTAKGLAARFADDKHRALTRDPHHAGWASLETAGVLRRVGSARGDDGWWTVEVIVNGGPARSADVLRQLIEAGVEIASFDRVGVSLADLITKLIGATPTADPHA
jgi:ABC-type multidrug transport system ATPase subunit